MLSCISSEAGRTGLRREKSHKLWRSPFKGQGVYRRYLPGATGEDLITTFLQIKFFGAPGQILSLNDDIAIENIYQSVQPAQSTVVGEPVRKGADPNRVVPVLIDDWKTVKEKWENPDPVRGYQFDSLVMGSFLRRFYSDLTPLTALWFPNVDQQSHSDGLQAVQRKLREADEQIAALINGNLEPGNRLDSTVIIVTSDHGMTDISRSDTGIDLEGILNAGRYPAESGRSPPATRGDWTDVVVAPNGRMAHLYLTKFFHGGRLTPTEVADYLISKAGEKLEEVWVRNTTTGNFQLIHGDPGSAQKPQGDYRANALLNGSALISGERVGDIVLTAKVGYQFPDAENRTKKASHGSLIEGDSWVPVLAMGPGIRNLGKTAATGSRTIDIVDVVAKLIGTRPPSQSDPADTLSNLLLEEP